MTSLFMIILMYYVSNKVRVQGPVSVHLFLFSCFSYVSTSLHFRQCTLTVHCTLSLFETQFYQKLFGHIGPLTNYCKVQQREQYIINERRYGRTFVPASHMLLPHHMFGNDTNVSTICFFTGIIKHLLLYMFNNLSKDLYDNIFYTIFFDVLCFY